MTDSSPHHAIAMLYAGALDAIRRARMALAQRQVAVRGKAITHAIRIIGEGLNGSVDERGGELAVRLRSLYEYMCTRLLRANIEADDAGLVEVAELLTTLKDAWDAIAPGKTAAAPVTARPGAAR